MKDTKRTIAWWLGQDNAMVGEAKGIRFRVSYDGERERPWQLFLVGQDEPLGDAETLDEAQWDAEAYLATMARVAS
jgi:hypothetical protein